MTTVVQTQTLKLNQIRIDGGTQSRVDIDEQVVAEYADLYHQGIQLPPVTVFYDGTDYWLADGFHRSVSLEPKDTRANPLICTC